MSNVLNNDVLNQVVEQSQAFLAPVVKANKLAVVNLEKLVGFQMSVAQSYVDLSLERLKAAAQVEDVKGAQAFLNEQVKVAGVVRQKLLDDTKALADLLADMKVDADNLVKDSAAEMNQAAKATVSKVKAA